MGDNKQDSNTRNDNDNEDKSSSDEQIVNSQTQSEQTTPQITEPTYKVVNGDSRFKFQPAVVILVLVLMLVAGLAAYMLSNGSDDDIFEQQPTAQQEVVSTLGAAIVTVEGAVEYSMDGETWTEATGGESLAHLDYVRTLNNSRAIVLFDDGSVARLDGNTELYLSSLEAENIEVTLIDGQIYSRVVESENRKFTVVTANERFQALGTAYKTSTDQQKDVVEVYQSNVKISSSDLEVSEGNKYDTETKELGEIDLAGLTEDEFAQWNKQKDSESEAFKNKLGVLDKKIEKPEEPAPKPSSSTPTGIVLSGSKSSSGVKLSWTMNGVSSSQGFKIVRSTSDNTPTYGENEAIYVGESSARSSFWYSDNGKTHNYRICVYNNGSCSSYSNSVQVTSPKIEKEAVKSGEISLTILDQGISWTLVGGTAPHGYKIVLSSSPEPSYPEDSIKYVGAETTTATLPDKSPGTYYVRVCKYTNGTQNKGCVDYSNEVEYIR